MIEAVAALRGVVAALEEVSIDYFVVGSVAGAAWGLVRTTRDVDLVAVLDPASLPRVLGALDRTVYYVPDRQAAAALESHDSFNVIHLVGGGKVDVFVADPALPFNASRLARRIRVEVLGVPAWVASVEDVVLAKLRWRRASRSEQQWRDCVEIVAANPDLDREYLRSWAGTLGVAADLEELLAD